MKKYMPLEGLRWSRDSGSALCDTSQNSRSRTGWGGKLFLPCYTFHIFIIGKTMGKFEQYIYSISDYTAPLFWIIVVILTVIISWLIMKLPYMDRIFRI